MQQFKSLACRFSERLILHNQNHTAQHEAVSLGMHISEEDKMVFTCISTQYMLFASADAVKAQLCVKLNGDSTWVCSRVF